jgi:phospholipid-translocating ATPase
MDGNIYPANIDEPNIINNSKYTVISFLPLVLYHQFRYFFNLFFLLIALSQFVNMLKVGFMFTYVAPLALVLGFTLLK